MVEMHCRAKWRNAKGEAIAYRFHVVGRNDNKALMNAMIEIEHFVVAMKDVLEDFDYVGMKIEGIIDQYE